MHPEIGLFLEAASGSGSAPLAEPNVAHLAKAFQHHVFEGRRHGLRTHSHKHTHAHTHVYIYIRYKYNYTIYRALYYIYMHVLYSLYAYM